MVATHALFHKTTTSRTPHSRLGQPLQIRLLFLVLLNQPPYYHSSVLLFHFFTLRRPFRSSQVFLSQILELGNWARINGSMPLVSLASQAPSTNTPLTMFVYRTHRMRTHIEDIASVHSNQIPSNYQCRLVWV